MAHTPESLHEECAHPPARRQIAAGWWFALAAVLITIDFVVTPYLAFGATLALPVVLASLYSGTIPALTLAVMVPLAPLLLTLSARGEPWNFSSLSTAMLRIGVFMFIARLVAHRTAHEAELEREVEVLHGFVPICMHCKSIRNDAGEWEPLELYFTRRTEATFTHGLCRRCAEVHYPDYRPAVRDQDNVARRSSA